MAADFQLVMFDLDGTLIATAPEIFDAVNDTLTRFELAPVSLQQVNDWIGHGTRTLLVQALAFSGGVSVESVRNAMTTPTLVTACTALPPEGAPLTLGGERYNLDEIAAEFDVHYQRRCGTRSHLYPQVRETLITLRARGVKLAVVTNKEARYTRTVLDAHQLTPLFHQVVSGDTLPTKKPNPAGIHLCLEQFGVPPAHALFVGDSSIDVATARNAGVAVWALPYGYNMGQPIEACGPDRVIADCAALLAE